MDQAKPLISIQCPEHKAQFIGTIDTDSNAKKLGYCYECILESHEKGTFPQKMRTPVKYLQETSDFYNKCRQRAHNAGDPPVEYINELAKKAERLEMLSKHIDQEKQKVTQRFEDIRKNMLAMIEVKEKECLKLLEDQISRLSDLYKQYEKLLATGWFKPSDLEAIYPTSDALEQKLSKIDNIDQLQTFLKGVAEDVQIENLYCDEKNGLERRKAKINFIINCAQRVESSLPAFQGKLLDSSLEGLQSLMKELLKGFSQEEIRVQNSIPLNMKFASQIINGKQYEVLKGWLSDFKNLDLKLLYRGSEDGMSAQMFHSKCDDKGATVTLIKCKFNRDVSSSLIGGFIDQSWNSINNYTASQKAFLFSLTAGIPPVKCPIQESQYAFCGHINYGPLFGAGHDLHIANDCRKGTSHPRSYLNTAALSPNNQTDFTVEEIEVFQVQ